MALAFDSQDLAPDEAARRFAWARRQGRPAWLWPDVEIEDWRAALSQIEAVTREVLTQGASDSPLGAPAAVMGLAGYTSGLGPLLGLWREQGRISTNTAVAEALALQLAHGRGRAARREAAARALVGALAERGIGPLILKGGHTAYAYFPEAGVRPASDLDLLVAQEQAQAAEAALREAGFTFADRGAWESSWRAPGSDAWPRSLTLAHAEDPWAADLHTSLTVPVGPGGPAAELDRARPLASRARWPADARARVLEQPLLLLHLAAHAGSGLHNLTLLRLVELALVIRQDGFRGALDWERFLATGRQTGALAVAYPALKLAEDLCPGLLPDRVLDLCAQAAPEAVRRVIARLTPATAQRIERSSLAEHFMWAGGWRGRAQQLAADVLPAVGSWRRLLSIYEARAWRLIRGRVEP